MSLLPDNLPPTATPAAISKPTPGQPASGNPPPASRATARPAELAGPTGPDPTRYGDWERAGRCIDF